MTAFHGLGEAELARLDEGELVAHALRARAAGEGEQALAALRIFAFGMEAALRAFVRARLDSHGDAAVDEVAERALEDAVRSIHTLRGTTAAEARGFVFKIARLRIADFHRSGRVQTEPIESGGEGPGGVASGAGGASGVDIDGEMGAIDTALLLEQALGELREDHRTVVELFVVSGFSARETVDHLRSRFDSNGDDSMSEQNVHQIGSRFRKDLRRRLDEAERTR